MAVTDTTDENWYGVDLAGQRGYVPRNYVEEFQEGSSAAFTEYDEAEPVLTRSRTIRGRGATGADMRSKRMTAFAQRLEALTDQVDDDGYSLAPIEALAAPEPDAAVAGPVAADAAPVGSSAPPPS